MLQVFKIKLTIRSLSIKFFTLFFSVFSTIDKCKCQDLQLDILIKNAMVYDGLNNAPKSIAVGIKGEKIMYLGSNDSSILANRTIDANGAVLSPGFIDPHTHADRWLRDPNRNQALPWIYQGVTTVFAGNDGFGTYNIKSTFDKLEKTGMGVNLALFVGFGSIRSKVLGKGNVKPSFAQMEEMKDLVAKGMQEGALGLSTGLLYVPQRYSSTKEIIELSKVASKYGAIYDTHIRSEGTGMINSVEEALKIGREANIPLHISHIKVSGSRNWGMSTKAIDLIRASRAEGVDITANQYPYTASLTSLKTNLIPGWAQAGGNKQMLKRFEDKASLTKIKNHLSNRTDQANKLVMISSNHISMKDLNGKTLFDICQEWKLPIEDVVIKILMLNPSVSAITFSMSERDVLNFMQEPWVMTGSDGGGEHPRTFATFSHLIEHYVFQKHIFDIQWMIYRSTGLTAKTFGITDRGVIKEGNYADIIIFYPERIKANSTFENIKQYSTGMSYVFINGELIIDNGLYTNKLMGKPILKH